jgi:MATE family multidrug resistance protein
LTEERSTPADPPPPSLGRRFARLTFYNILANVTVPLASLVDTALLGHLADIRFLAGVALAAVLFEYIYWTFGFLRMGTTGTTAQALGQGDEQETYRVLYRALLVAWTLSALILLLWLPLRELGFALLTSTAEVEAAGRAYFDARIWAAPAVLSNFAFIGWFLGREDGRSALVIALVANVANIVLDYLFILRLGMAASGAGLATALAQCLMLAAAAAIFFYRYRPHRWSWREVLDRPSLLSLIRLNRDILLRTVALITTFALFINFSAILGTAVLTANAILSRLQSLVAYFIDGAAFATESLAGIFRGARRQDQLDRVRRLALSWGAAFTMPFLALILIAPRPVYRLLTSHEETLEHAVAYGSWLVPVLLIGSFAYIYDGLFLGLTAGRPLRNSMVASTLLVFLPLAIAAVRLESNHLLWLAMVGFMVTRAGLLGWAERGLRLDHQPPGGDPGRAIDR